MALTPGFSGDVGIVLSLGTTDRYCARFGRDDVKNDATLTKRKNAPAPGGLPVAHGQEADASLAEIHSHTA